jgi:hypothetical protein
MGKLNTNFIAHEIAFMVFGNALLCGFPIVEFHKSVPNFELNVDDVSYFAKATLQVFLSGVLRKAPNVDLVRLDLLLPVCVILANTGTARIFWIFRILRSASVVNRQRDAGTS